MHEIESKIAYAVQERILVGVVLSKRMLEAIRQCNEPRIAVRQFEQSAAEPILRVGHVCLFKYLLPFVLEQLQLLICP